MAIIRHRRRIAALPLLLLIQACSSPSEKAAAAAAQASIYFNVGDYRAAAESARQAVLVRDDVPEYWLILGRSQLAQSDYMGALDSFRRAYELDRTNIEALQILADISVMAERLDEAEDFIDEMLALNPRDPRARIAKGFLALKRDRNAEALEIAEQVIREDPRYIGAIVLKARVLTGAGDHQKAAELLENAMRVHGQNPPLLEALQEVYQRAGDAGGQRRTLERRLALAPGNVELQLEHARTLYRIGQPSAGFDQLVRLHRAHPTNYRIPGLIADLWLRLGGEPAGPREIRQMADGAGPAMQVAMARYALDTRWPGEAARLLKPLIPAEPTSATLGVVGLYARALLELGKSDEAGRLAEKVLELDSTNPRALVVRTRLAMERRQLDDALASAMLLSSESPRVSKYRALLAEVHMARGEHNLALQTLKEANREFPDSSAVLGAYVAFLESQGNRQGALALAEAFTAHNRNSFEGWGIRGRLCRRAGDAECSSLSNARQQELDSNRKA